MGISLHKIGVSSKGAAKKAAASRARRKMELTNGLAKRKMSFFDGMEIFFKKVLTFSRSHSIIIYVVRTITANQAEDLTKMGA